MGILEKGAAGRANLSATPRHEAVMRALLLALSMLVAATGAFAQEPQAPAAPRSWQSLSPQQQHVLQSFQGRWDSLPPEKQQSLARGSERWVNMSPEQRAGAQERFKQWRALPPEQRELVRQRWRQFKALPPDEQQRVREQFQRFRQMPPQRRMELRQQWRRMTPQERHNALQRMPPARGGSMMRPSPPRRFLR